MKKSVLPFALLTGAFVFAGALSASAESPKTKASVSEDDAEFLVEAAHDNMEMLALAKLATTKGSHDKVKEFAKEATKMHAANGAQLKGLAAKKGVKLPTALEADDRMKIDIIEKLSGLTFDKRFMKEMVDEHVDEIKEYEESLRECKDADVKSWAEKALPTLRDHLAKAKTVSSILEGNASL